MLKNKVSWMWSIYSTDTDSKYFCNSLNIFGKDHVQFIALFVYDWKYFKILKYPKIFDNSSRQINEIGNIRSILSNEVENNGCISSNKKGSSHSILYFLCGTSTPRR